MTGWGTRGRGNLFKLRSLVCGLIVAFVAYLKGAPMPTITTKDGMEIFYKDWGTGQPIVFSHGWPLSADDWDAQMLVLPASWLSRDRA
jgi:hypothetical protein